MRIAVCDDCMEDALSLKRFLGGYDVCVFPSAAGLLANIEKKNILFDLYILDIFMDEVLDGIELAKKLREKQEDAVICFVSTSNDFYREAYDLYAVQYLLKPVQEADLRKLLKRVAKNLAKGREKKISFQARGRVGSIPYGKVLYISSREHSVFISCTDGSVQEYKGKLSELAGQVCGDTFMRCHQSFIVNMHHVEGLYGTDLTVAGTQIPVSRRYFADVKRRYQEILFEEVD